MLLLPSVFLLVATTRTRTLLLLLFGCASGYTIHYNNNNNKHVKSWNEWKEPPLRREGKQQQQRRWSKILAGQPKSGACLFASSSTSSSPSRTSTTKKTSSITSTSLLFDELCSLTSVQPQGFIRLDNDHGGDSTSAAPSAGGEEQGGLSSCSDSSYSSACRGVYLNHNVSSGEVICSIPLSACIRDDQPPSWLMKKTNNDDNNDNDESEFLERTNDDDDEKWATRLAASFIDRRMKLRRDREGGGRGQSSSSADDLWLELLPDSDELRESLPIHWCDDEIQSTNCIALQLLVDTAYFTREESIQILVDGLDQCTRSCSNDNNDHDDSIHQPARRRRRRLCDDALDIVQTRSCRVSFPTISTPRTKTTTVENGDVMGTEEYKEDDVENTEPRRLRLLAPIFDFINHSSRPNAQFALEQQQQKQEVSTSSSSGQSLLSSSSSQDDNHSDVDEYHLVVRAMKDISANEQIFIDYGESTYPAWKCLVSYGFVPSFPVVPADDHDDDDIEEYNYFEGEHVAEIYIDGIRYEVSPTSIPQDIVDNAIAMAASSSSSAATTTGAFTPDIALQLAYRIADSATAAVDTNNEEKNQDVVEGATSSTITTPTSHQLSRALRSNQQQILLACSTGLREWAQQQIQIQQ